MEPPEDNLLTAFRAAVRAKIAADLQAEGARADELRRGVLGAARDALRTTRQQGLVGQAWLFGSFVWGRPADRSDVDLLVDGCPDPIALASAVGRALSRDVHVVTMERAPASLKERALAEGLPL